MTSLPFNERSRQSWKFADDLAIVFLGGEVVVDYSVRLNQELDWARLWITAWANAMPGYIPSCRVLLEGGYEVDFSQVYHDQPGRYALEVENVLVHSIKDLISAEFAAEPDQQPAPFHALPSGESAAFERIARWSKSEKPDDEAALVDWIRRHIPVATAAVERIVRNEGETEEIGRSSRESVTDSVKPES